MERDLMVQVVRRNPDKIEDISVDGRARQRTLRVIALLLALQSLAVLGICGAYIYQIDWEAEFNQMALSVRAMDTLLLAALFIPVGIFGLATAVGMWLGHRGAWLRALIIQSILLLFCLSSYVIGVGDRFIYWLMLLCIILVLYLNTNDVRLTFYGRSNKGQRYRAR